MFSNPTPNYELKAEIILHGKKIAEFALMAGINPKTFSMILSGRYIPTDKQKNKIMKALKKLPKKYGHANA